MSLIGRGRGVALWLNPNAKQVKAGVISAFRRCLPDAHVVTAKDMAEAKQAAHRLARHPPELLLCGGGDGTAVTLLNLLRSEGVRQFPPIGFLRLGTGNGWPRATGAPPWRRSVDALPHLPLHPPTKRFNLVNVEGRLCHFAGVGWDAMVLHDYRRNIRRRERQLVAPRLATTLSRSILGYLYAIARRTVPRELGKNLTLGRPRVLVQNLGEPAFTLDKKNHLVAATDGRVLFNGYLSVGIAGSEPYWGGGFMAFPFATAMPGRINLRIYDRPVLEGVALTVPLWTGRRVPGMHDFFVTRARFTFSRPMPFQVGGDVVGYRKSLELSVADEVLDAVDWPALVH